jgi:hypothetical protein
LLPFGPESWSLKLREEHRLRVFESMGEERKVYKLLVGNPEGKRPFGRPRRRWEDGIRMDLRELGLGVWIGFDWLRTGTGGGLL